MHVERVSGRYIEPEIVDLDDGCLFRIHKRDVGETGAAWLAQVLAGMTQWWGLRPSDSPLGPVVPVRFERVNDLPEPFGIVVDHSSRFITYAVDEKTVSLTQYAADRLSRLATERTPRWQPLPRDGRERLSDEH
ncbi:hypothetical protein ACF061_01155 [Streptomyces sp. NPDC015220]|uniref:hypothetical protein n=1 Tax=Streptomyces sp. NPDC015220 TaxID=3364947 RepID=UPI0036F4EE80